MFVRELEEALNICWKKLTWDKSLPTRQEMAQLVKGCPIGLISNDWEKAHII